MDFHRDYLLLEIRAYSSICYHTGAKYMRLVGNKNKKLQSDLKIIEQYACKALVSLLQTKFWV